MDHAGVGGRRGHQHRSGPRQNGFPGKRRFAADRMSGQFGQRRDVPLKPTGRSRAEYQTCFPPLLLGGFAERSDGALFCFPG